MDLLHTITRNGPKIVPCAHQERCHLYSHFPTRFFFVLFKTHLAVVVKDSELLLSGRGQTTKTGRLVKKTDYTTVHLHTDAAS